jgi:hypothetical protein
MPEPENHPATLGGGAGGGGSGEVIGTGAELPADILAHPDTLLAANGLGSDGLLDLSFGLAPVNNLLSGVGDTVNALTNDLSALPVVGGLLAEADHLVNSLLGSAPGVGEIHFGGLSLGGAVVSGGTLAFGADATASAVPQLFNNGSYTDFGVAMTSNAVSAPGLIGLVDHLDQAATLVDLARVVDHADHGTTPVQLNDDHILRTPLDLLG